MCAVCKLPRMDLKLFLDEVAPIPMPVRNKDGNGYRNFSSVYNKSRARTGRTRRLAPRWWQRGHWPRRSRRGGARYGLCALTLCAVI